MMPAEAGGNPVPGLARIISRKQTEEGENRMEIRKATMEDLPRILALYEQARAFMKANGNPDQWGDNYPEPELVRQDIAGGHSYVCEAEIFMKI